MCVCAFIQRDMLTMAWSNLRVCSRREVAEEGGISTEYAANRSSRGDDWGARCSEIDGGDDEASWDHVWLDAIIGVVAGHDEKVGAAHIHACTYSWLVMHIFVVAHIHACVYIDPIQGGKYGWVQK